MKTLEQLKKKELIKLITEVRPKADAYDRVCEQLGIKDNILSFIKNLNVSDVSNGDFTEHHLEDKNGNKFCVNLPKDAKNIFVINTFDDEIRVGFKTKFGGKKFLETYIEV